MAKKPRLRAIPLGGLGEIGRNMMALEYDENIVVIDAGLMFPEEEMLGVDLVLPDVTYLAERKDKVLGFLLTIGASINHVINHRVQIKLFTVDFICHTSQILRLHQLELMTDR